jgi:hypothetical protein
MEGAFFTAKFVLVSYLLKILLRAEDDLVSHLLSPGIILWVMRESSDIHIGQADWVSYQCLSVTLCPSSVGTKSEAYRGASFYCKKCIVIHAFGVKDIGVFDLATYYYRQCFCFGANHDATMEMPNGKKAMQCNGSPRIDRCCE